MGDPDKEDPLIGIPNVHGTSSRVDRLLQERIRRNRSHQQFDYDEAAYEGPLPNDSEGMLCSERLVVVANRLPVTCSKDPQGFWQLQVSAGGLVSALKGVTTYKTVWIGWPGIWVKPGKERDSLTGMLMEEGCIPVWVEPTLLDMYYNGFCNSVLWQLFHYVPLNIDSWLKMSEHRAMQMQWQAYQVANQKFADVVLEHYEPHDIMWVQDYHLMLLPSLLKAVVPKMKVGFFLHTPFPSSEMYRTLPVREEVLRAVLGADLIGFHTYDYARHFISSCTRILGLEGTPEGVENNGSITRVGTFPIGIDPERFTRALETDEVQSHVAKLLNKYAGRKIMLGVDRLDMVKGIPQKLLAFEKFLEEHPEWRDKVLLVQIAVPSRTDVPEYQKLRSQVHEIVGRINGQYGTLTYVPIYHLDTSLSFTELCALYAVTDVALVTSLRDGMNLVSYEYVACQSDNAGVLVLSEFAGAAQSLGAGAILVNPWNINDMAQAIEDALCMSEEERRERHRQNYMHVQTHTAQNWADTFISELNDTHIEADLRMRHAPPPLDLQEVVNSYKVSKCRLVVLGYNATLTMAVEAAPGRGGGAASKRQHDLLKAMAKPNPKVLACIQDLCQDPCNLVAIFSGSETSKLEEIFGELPVWLAAENGVFVRPPPQHTPYRPGQRQWHQLFDGIHREWMESVQLVFDYFCERTPRSFVETRETSLVWNYKHADVEFGRIQARDLLQHLWTGPISNAPVEIIQGGKSVEVRPVGVTKGTAMQRMVQLMGEVYGSERVNFDFVLCIGHLLARDENMYSYFEGVRVDGTGPSAHATRTEHHRTAATQHVVSGATPTPQLNLHQQAQLQMQQQAAAAGVNPHFHVMPSRGHMNAVAAAAVAVAADPLGNLQQAVQAGLLSRGTPATQPVSNATLQQIQYQQQHLAAQQAQHPELYARLQAAAAMRAALASTGDHPQAAADGLPAVLRGVSLPNPGTTSSALQAPVPSSGSAPAVAAVVKPPQVLEPVAGSSAPTNSTVPSPPAPPPRPTPLQAALAAQSKIAAAVARAEQRSSVPPLPLPLPESNSQGSGASALHNSHDLQASSSELAQQGETVQPELPASRQLSQQQTAGSEQLIQQQTTGSEPTPEQQDLGSQLIQQQIAGPQQLPQEAVTSLQPALQLPQPVLQQQQQLLQGTQACAPAQQGDLACSNAGQAVVFPDGNNVSISPFVAGKSPHSVHQAAVASPTSHAVHSPVQTPAAGRSPSGPSANQHPHLPHPPSLPPPAPSPTSQPAAPPVSPSTAAHPVGSSPNRPAGPTIQGGFTVSPTAHTGAASSSAVPATQPSPSQAGSPGKLKPPTARGSPSTHHPTSHGHAGGLGQAVQSYLQANSRDARTPVGLLPPRYLFTCTVGRNRSKARYALGAASEVADLLDAIVQQAIYHKDPPSFPHLHDMHLAHAMSRNDSYSSTEPLSPDSMFTLISNWKNYRTSGALTGGSTGGVPSAPDLVAMAMQGSVGSLPAAAGPAVSLPANAVPQPVAAPNAAPAQANLGRKSKSGLIAPALAALAAATNPTSFAVPVTPSSLAGGADGSSVSNNPLLPGTPSSNPTSGPATSWSSSGVPGSGAPGGGTQQQAGDPQCVSTGCLAQAPVADEVAMKASANQNKDTQLRPASNSNGAPGGELAQQQQQQQQQQSGQAVRVRPSSATNRLSNSPSAGSVQTLSNMAPPSSAPFAGNDTISRLDRPVSPSLAVASGRPLHAVTSAMLLGELDAGPSISQQPSPASSLRGPSPSPPTPPSGVARPSWQGSL